MNLFLIAYRASALPAGAVDRMRSALDVVTDWVPLPERVEWTSEDGCAAMVCAAHAPERVGGIRYWWTGDEGMAVFAGRPFTWRREHEADGAAPLDPAFFARPAAEWTGALDGRAAVARYDTSRGAIEIFPDTAGLLAVYTRTLDGVRYVSNGPRVLEALGGAPAWRPRVIADLVGAGWSISGDPIWEGIDRVPRGMLEVWEPGGVRHEAVLSDATVAGYLDERRFDAEESRALLEAFMGASLDWPGRPALIPLTSGKDSRVIVEAALQIGAPFRSMTYALLHEPGYPETEDVRVARALLRQRGVEHQVERLTWPGVRVGLRQPEGLELLRALGSGAVAMQEAQGMRWPVDDGPLPLVPKGFGGETARGWTGRVADGRSVTDHMVEKRMPRYSFSVLSETGRRLVRESLDARVSRILAAGAVPADVPSVMYFDCFCSGWAAGLMTVQDASEDTLVPLDFSRLLPQLLGSSLEDRLSQRFHRDVLATYGVAPTAAVSAPPSRVPKLARRASRELRRLARVRPGHPPAQDPLNVLRNVARSRFDAVERSELWEVVDRRRARALLAIDATRLDSRSRLTVSRLATAIALAGGELAPPPAVVRGTPPAAAPRRSRTGVAARSS